MFGAFSSIWVCRIFLLKRMLNIMFGSYIWWAWCISDLMNSNLHFSWKLTKQTECLLLHTHLHNPFCMYIWTICHFETLADVVFYNVFHLGCFDLFEMREQWCWRIWGDKKRDCKALQPLTRAGQRDLLKLQPRIQSSCINFSEAETYTIDFYWEP